MCAPQQELSKLKLMVSKLCLSGNVHVFQMWILTDGLCMDSVRDLKERKKERMSRVFYK